MTRSRIYKSKAKFPLEETVLSSQISYHGNFLKIQKDHVRQGDGSERSREFVVHPGAALVVPVLANGNLIMIEQYRHAVKRMMLEFPAGKLDPGESSAEAAARELREEVGLASKQIELMTQIHPVIGYSDEAIDLYVAHNLQDVGADPDEGEFLNIFEIPLDEALELLALGEISDVKTSLALFWYKDYFKKEE